MEKREVVLRSDSEHIITSRKFLESIRNPNQTNRGKTETRMSVKQRPTAQHLGAAAEDLMDCRTIITARKDRRPTTKLGSKVKTTDVLLNSFLEYSFNDDAVNSKTSEVDMLRIRLRDLEVCLSAKAEENRSLRQKISVQDIEICKLKKERMYALIIVFFGEQCGLQISSIFHFLSYHVSECPFRSPVNIFPRVFAAAFNISSSL
jgi:hypothetical protein